MTNSQRVALVTGGSGGVGRQVSERLAAQGMSVVVHYSGHPDRAQEVVDSVTAGGSEARSVMCADVAEDADVEAIFNIDVVVSTAGIMLLAPMAEFSL